MRSYDLESGVFDFDLIIEKTFTTPTFYGSVLTVYHFNILIEYADSIVNY